MAIMRWDPWSELVGLQRDVNALLERSIGALRRGRDNMPAMDVFRTDTGVCVRLELPGMKTEDIDVSVHERQLVISAERRSEEKIEDERWVRRERSYGRFQRSFALPPGIDADQIKATFENGVLQLEIPNPPEPESRRIQVSAAASSQDQVDVTEAREAPDSPQQAPDQQPA